MRNHINHLCLFALLLPLMAGAESAKPTSRAISTTTSDGITLHGEYYTSTQCESGPLVLMFHQAGSNGRGEYGELAAWLNDSGYRVMAWDQRSGSERFDYSNRTVDALPEENEVEYCDVYPDLEAALAFALEETGVSQVMIWGSSYSASLVYRLAAEHPDDVSALVAASPAAGGPMEQCRARMWADQIRVPALVLRPEKEMEYDSVIEQRKILQDAGADVWVVENGVHGSSMLVDARTQHDMSAIRARLIAWLSQAGASC